MIFHDKIEMILYFPGSDVDRYFADHMDYGARSLVLIDSQIDSF